VAETRKVVKFFLASPSDLASERKVAKRVIDEFNDVYASVFGYYVELVGWEDTVSVFGRPQEIINRELAQCEYFVGMLWKKWGTPPDVASRHSSGFEEEYSLSVDRRESDGQPEISLFFKDVSPDSLSDPGPELSKVVEFKQKLIDEKRILFQSFADPGEFEVKFRRCIASHVINLSNKDRDESAGRRQAPTTGGENGLPTGEGSSWISPLSPEGAQFLRDFVSRTEREEDNKNITAADVARFRLLDTIVSRQGNDEQCLGTHDANLLFVAHDEYIFGSREIDGLISTGLALFESENVPVWHWLEKGDLDRGTLLLIYSSVSSMPKRRVGALSAMTLLEEPLPSDLLLSREDHVATWLADRVPRLVKAAALRYLGECGLSADAEAVRKELDKNDSQTRAVAADAFIRIRLRESRDLALDALLELQPPTVDAKLLSQILVDTPALSTDRLLKAVTHQDATVRHLAVKFLRRRGELPTQLAEQLMDDPYGPVRYESLMSEVDRDKQFSDADARKVLVRPEPGVGALRWLNQPLAYDESFWQEYKTGRLRSLDDEQLDRLVREDVPFSIDARLVLAQRHFDRLGRGLRRFIDDRYTSMFQAALTEMSSWAKSETMEKVRSLEEDTRKRFTRESLELICRVGRKNDLPRLRKALNDGIIEYSDAVLAFLSRYGDWSDIDPIIKSLERRRPGRYVLSLYDNNEAFKSAAKAIYRIGRSRLAELLTVEMPNGLLKFVLLNTRDADFRRLNDALATTLLLSPDDGVRKTAALKCVRSFGRRRLVQLLQAYLNGGHRYYNVIHWLDLGVSLSVARSARAAHKELDAELQK
jgi:hypothetical protein